MSDSFDAAAWQAELEEKRAEKDRFFAEHKQSPIPPAERDTFDGLSYFPPNADYRVLATVEVHDDPTEIAMETSSGREMDYRRVVTFRFDLHGDEGTAGGDLSLSGYRRDGDDDGAVFVPFRDKTTGQQTYAGGRYMELAADRDLADGDEVPLDFNLAYTPFCAYSDTFDCPLPPEENWLPLPIPAGERDDG